MHKLMLSAVAMTAFATMLVPAQAELMWGPTKNGSQCWQSSAGWSKDGFGYWGACPATASTPVAAKPAARAKRNAAR